MKAILTLALTIGLLLSFTACSNRNMPKVSTPSVIPPASSIPGTFPDDRIIDDDDRITDDDLFRDEDLRDESLIDRYNSDINRYDNGDLSREERRSSSVPSIAASTDFSKIGALDGKKLGWGPGTHKDDEGRPIGATDYQKKYGSYDAMFIAPSTKDIYLTFDQGYENGYTASILDTLKEKEVKAVFFLTYDYAKRQPELVRRMIDEGHIIGNHSYSHKSYPEDLNLEQAVEDIAKMHQFVLDEYGYTMTQFRFPMGYFSEKMLALVQSTGYKSVFWSFAYADWDVNKQVGYEKALQKTTAGKHPGAIYLLHSVGKDNSEILGALIDDIRAAGYTLSLYDPQ